MPYNLAFPMKVLKIRIINTMFQSLVNLRKDLPKMKRMVSGKTACWQQRPSSKTMKKGRK